MMKILMKISKFPFLFSLLHRICIFSLCRNDTSMQQISSNSNIKRQIQKRKRQKKYVSEDEINDEQLINTNSIPLNDCTNSTLTSKSNKRKKRS